MRAFSLSPPGIWLSPKKKHKRAQLHVPDDLRIVVDRLLRAEQVFDLDTHIYRSGVLRQIIAANMIVDREQPITNVLQLVLAAAVRT